MAIVLSHARLKRSGGCTEGALQWGHPVGVHVDVGIKQEPEGVMN